MRNETVDKRGLLLVASLLMAAGVVCGSCGDDDDKPDPGPQHLAPRVKQRDIEQQDTEPEDGEKWSVFAKNLEHPEWQWRRSAAQQIGKLGPAAKDAVPALIKAMDDRNEEVRIAVMLALGQIGPAAGTAASSIVWSLGSDNERVCEIAIDTLSKLGPIAVRVVAKSIDRKLMKRKLDDVPGAGGFELVDKDWRKLANAAKVLEEVGADAGDGVAAMMRIIGTECGDPREVPSCYEAHRAATEALKRVGAGAVPLLIDALKDRAPNTRAKAAAALGKFGKDAVEAVPALTQMLKHDNSTGCAAAARALGQIGAPGIPALLEALHDMRPMVRDPAARALIRMGPEAKAAVPELNKMLNDENRWTRRAAKEVLSRI